MTEKKTKERRGVGRSFVIQSFQYLYNESVDKSVNRLKRLVKKSVKKYQEIMLVLMTKFDGRRGENSIFHRRSRRRGNDSVRSDWHLQIDDTRTGESSG